MNIYRSYKLIQGSRYKIIAVILALLYLGGPLKDPVTYALHQITHSIEMPQLIIEHEVNNKHRSWEHSMADQDHEHTMVEALTALFEAMEDHDQKDELPPTVQNLDKHIPLEYQMALVTAIMNLKPFILNKSSLNNGYLRIEIPPPLS